MEIEKEEEGDDATSLYDSGGPPVPPDPELVFHDLSCQGTVAMALQEALEELQQSTTLTELKDKYNLRIDSEKVLRAFAESIVEQQQCQYDAQIDDAMKQQPLPYQQRRSQGMTGAKSSSNADDDDHTDNHVPPAAVLRGRINHYNRFGAKWRIVVDDVELIPRRAINAHRPSKRDRNEMSLWSIVSQQQQSLSNSNSSNEDELPIKIPRLELLVYNDL
jgi:hypothetical protein